VRIIDIHSHFFSRPFFEALAAQAPGGDAVADRLDRLAAATGIEMPLPSVADHVARWTEALDEGGVEHMATFASLPDEIPAVAGHSADDLREMLDRSGFRGVLLFPAMHHFHIAGAESERLLHVLEEHESTVFVHCGLLVVKLRDLLGLPRPYDLSYANPLDIIPAANRFRKVRFVIPHFGAGFFREALMAGTQCENIYVDTSSSNSWISTQPGLPDLREVLRRALEVFGPGRVLFGTDSNVFPAGWRRDRYESQLELLQSLGTSDEDLAAVFGGNAARLLGLDA
jgi:predicted TIM-barrel fold metal-dependent hydrolase